MRKSRGFCFVSWVLPRTVACCSFFSHVFCNFRPASFYPVLFLDKETMDSTETGDKSEETSVEDDSILLLVRNVPSDFHSTDLRNFFSLFVEKGAFRCFHFRHRPETVDTDAKKSIDKDETSKTQKTLCCFVKCFPKLTSDFIQQYNGKNWETSQGQLLSTRCHILRVRMTENTEKTTEKNPKNNISKEGNEKSSTFPSYLTREERRAEQRYHLLHQQLKKSEIRNLIEMTPPSVMPKGNVGTPTKHFIQLINSCQMPAGLIQKLGLRFPKGRKNRKFGQVGMDYGSDVVAGEDWDDEEEEDFQAQKTLPATASRNFVWFDKSDAEEGAGEEGDDCDNCEEWERHEALNDDVTTHERNKEKLFEDETEVVWEKGGPGIVWNMDANFWKAKGGGDDLDESTDDWDVDMSCYYETGKNARPGDKDAKDFLQMRKEQEIRNGTAPSIFRQTTPTSPKNAKNTKNTKNIFGDFEKNGKKFEKNLLKKTEIVKNISGDFEKHTKGIGKKLLEKNGWKKGFGIGKFQTGIVQPVPHNGQFPYSKRGFGFSGKVLPKKKPVLSSIHHEAELEAGNFKVQISTIFDEKDFDDNLKRRAPAHRLTYRSSES